MSKYNGPSPLIADGEPLTASTVSDEFSYLATSLNSVDKNNWPNSSKRFVTNRSVHHDALTVPFLQNQLIEDEPATLLFMGRGGDGAENKPTAYSLGDHENNYTIDGCSVRVILNRDALLKVDAFVQFDALKISNHNKDIQTAPDLGTEMNLRSIDLQLDFNLYCVQPGEATGPSLASVRKRMRLEAAAPPTRDLPNSGVGGVVSANSYYFYRTNKYRRGTSVHLSCEKTISGADPNGSAYDVFVKVVPTILAAETYQISGSSYQRELMDNAIHNNRLFLVHALSTSRYISARAFVL
jgi:hypothetical protein